MERVLALLCVLTKVDGWLADKSKGAFGCMPTLIYRVIEISNNSQIPIKLWFGHSLRLKQRDFILEIVFSLGDTY